MYCAGIDRSAADAVLTGSHFWRTSMPITRLNDAVRNSVLVAENLAIHEAVKQRRKVGLSTLPLAFGESGLPVHPILKSQLAAAVALNAYGAVSGEAELREAVAGYFRRRGVEAEPDQVVSGPGSKPLILP
jgi:aspartate aminotransferase